MIHYSLRCAEGHTFDGWFRGSAGFAREKRLGRLTCPVCESKQIDLALMAPSVSAKSASRRAMKSGALPSDAQASGTEASTDAGTEANTEANEGTASDSVAMRRREIAAPSAEQQARRFLQTLRRHVESECDYVGKRFAEEARRRHNEREEQREELGDVADEDATRGIYGESTEEERRELQEDGIPFLSVPWHRKDDA